MRGRRLPRLRPGPSQGSVLEPVRALEQERGQAQQVGRKQDEGQWGRLLGGQGSGGPVQVLEGVILAEVREDGHPEAELREDGARLREGPPRVDSPERGLAARVGGRPERARQVVRQERGQACLEWEPSVCRALGPSACPGRGQQVCPERERRQGAARSATQDGWGQVPRQLPAPSDVARRDRLTVPEWGPGPHWARGGDWDGEEPGRPRRVLAPVQGRKRPELAAERKRRGQVVSMHRWQASVRVRV